MHLRFLLISFSIFAVLLSKGQDSEDGLVIDKIVAKVDNYIILKSELERSYLDYLSRGEFTGSNAKCEILQQLVINKMLVAQSEIDSIIVSEADVNANLDRRLSVMIQQFGGESEIERAYGKSLAQIRSEVYDNIKEQLTIQKMQSEITSDLKVTPS
jgi:peptidyl-prolyl cis-trans isomerase SurA